MSIEFVPHAYQKTAIAWILSKPKCGLFLDMGLGKTVCALTAIDQLIFDSLEIRKVLVIAPLRVARSVWAEECEKWAHLGHLRVAKVLGDAKERERALHTPADIYVINRENVAWLVKNAAFDFDLCVIDELSSFKSPAAQRFRALRKVIGRCKRVIGLTGTPAPNGLIDLWSQIYLLDRGERLGRTVSIYRGMYFHPLFGSGHIVYKYGINEGAADRIREKVSDICISMSKMEYLDMPDLLYQTASVKLPPEARRAYDEMERTALLSLDTTDILAVNAAAISNKLMQITGGAVYDNDGEVQGIHEAKLDALEDLIEQANGQPVLVFVAYRHETERIRRRFGSRVHSLDTAEDIARWNRGEYEIVVAHPASIGHGLNLQQGGHIAIWYSLTWSLELYQQAVDRLYRQGQTETVVVYHIIAAGTVDEAALAALHAKAEGQQALMDYLSARRREIVKEEQ